MFQTAILALLSMAGPLAADGERVADPVPQARSASNDVVSITDLATEDELRNHGWESLPATTGTTFRLLQGPNGNQKSFVAKKYALYEVIISPLVTGTGWPEAYYFATPWPPPTTPSPVLFFHHRFGKTHKDILVSTSYVQAATSRGWYVFAPIGASNKNFGSTISQLNMEFGFEQLKNTPGIHFDLDRVYGIGFSMGGGSVMSYAARHTDSTGSAMAAVVNHTGGVALAHTYDKDPGARVALDFWFGNATPPPVPYQLAAHSVIHYDPNDGPSGAFQVDDDMMRNIVDTPLFMVRASNDLIPYLSTQCDALDNHLQTVLGVFPGPRYEYQVVPFSGHEWSMLNENDALDFLEQFTRTYPTSNDTLITNDGRWYYFDVDLDADVVDEFARLTWDVNTGSNSLTIDSSNLSEIVVQTSLAGLDTQSALVVNNDPTDGIRDDIYLLNYPTAPSVLLDGQPSPLQYVPGIVRLQAEDDLPHIWTILP